MTEGSAPVLVWVTHLLGTGHLFRTAAIVRALRRRGATVVVASGGMPVRGIDFADAEVVQLPAVRSPDASFRSLVDSEGEAVGDEFLAERGDRLLDLLERCRPGAILTELFPFGRRKFRGEVDRLLAAAARSRPKPAVVVSVRDILEPPRGQSQVDHAVSRLRMHFDRILVHGDPAFVDLEASFPLPGDLKPLVTYTGYIGGADGQAGRADPAAGDEGVVVSAGGGAVGLPVYRAAIEGARLPAAAGTRWRILIGGNMSEAEFSRLAAMAAGNTIVERARPDFPDLLRGAAVSVSQAGYNTVADVLAAGTPAVLVPFTEGDEHEQRMRARLLAKAGRAVIVDPSVLSGQALVDAVAAARDLPRRDLAISMNGAERSADVILELLRGTKPT